MSKLRSYKVVDRDGKQFMTIIVHKNYTLKELNKLVQKGMYATVIDARSQLVNPLYVE